MLCILLIYYSNGAFYGRCASVEVDDGSKYLAVFIVAMILQAFGSVPLYVLGVTYLDDASPHGTASLHIGKYNTFCSKIQ